MTSRRRGLSESATPLSGAAARSPDADDPFATCLSFNMLMALDPAALA
jgi:hypothetical protein